MYDMLGKDELSGRDLWQNKSGEKSAVSEHDFFSVFDAHFANTIFAIRKRPKDFSNIYVDVNLTAEEIASIYSPPEGIKRHGVTPDFAIDNKSNNKTIYIEIKRQDGWVEGKNRSAGRGNAHERSCKYFTPGLLDALRKKGNIKKPHLPFWVVFQGDITRDPCRVREITLWFSGNINHYFFWRDSPSPDSLTRHFENHIKPILL